MRHEPVLRAETVRLLELSSGSRVIDATVGDGGHSEAILRATAPTGRILALDADPESLLRAERFLYDDRERVMFVRSNFTHLEDVAREHQFVDVDAVLMDLGWSMPQFKERGRGFSFERDEPLDMRYDPTGIVDSAATILATSSVREIEHMLRSYGEEPLYREIAQALVEYRDTNAVDTSAKLSEIVLNVYRLKLKTDRAVPWIGGIHPATRTFQALRIAVNREFDVLKNVLPQALRVLRSGGRVAVITFHSLEDRIVKQFFVRNSAYGSIVTKKPCIASDEECARNPAARSAKLRVFQKK